MSVPTEANCPSQTRGSPKAGPGCLAHRSFQGWPGAALGSPAERVPAELTPGAGKQWGSRALHLEQSPFLRHNGFTPLSRSALALATQWKESSRKESLEWGLSLQLRHQ